MSSCNASPVVTTTTSTTSTLPPTTTTTLPVPASARFNYSFRRSFPTYCYENTCGSTQVTFSGAIVPSATAKKSETSRGLVDVSWECRDCLLKIKNLDLDYPTELRLDDWTIRVWWPQNGGGIFYDYFSLVTDCDCHDTVLDIDLDPGETIEVPLVAYSPKTLRAELWNEVRPFINGSKKATIEIEWSYSARDVLGQN